MLTTGASGTVLNQGSSSSTNSVPFLDCTGQTSFNIDLNPIITDVNVAVNVTHTYVGDVTLRLTGPSGTVELMQRPGVPASTYGCSDNNINVTFDDQALQTAANLENTCGGGTNWNASGSYRSTGSLASFNGTDPTGNWFGTIVDGANEDSGKINSYTITITYNTNPTITCPAGGAVPTLADVPPPLSETLSGCSTTGSITSTTTTTGDNATGGTVTYEYTFTDECNNTATCSQAYTYGPYVGTVVTNKKITYRVKKD